MKNLNLKKLFAVSVLALLFLSMFAGLGVWQIKPAYATTYTFGNSASVSDLNLHFYSYSEYGRFQADTSSGTLASITVYLTASAANCKVAIYSDKAGPLPDARLGISNVFSPSTGWNVISTGNLTSVSITGSAWYWLGVWSDGTSDPALKGETTGGTHLEKYEQLPVVAGSGSTDSTLMGIYASYTGGGGGNPTFGVATVSTTENGTSADFSCEISGANGGGFIFGTNNTGTWVNETWASLDADPHWANVTKTLNDTLVIVQSKWYANDTDDDWSASELFNVTLSYTIFTQDFSTNITPLYYYGSGSYSMESPGVKVWNSPSTNSRGDLAYDTTGNALLTHVNMTETIIPQMPIPSSTEPLMFISYYSGGGSGYTSLVSIWASDDNKCYVEYMINGAASSHYQVTGVSFSAGNRYVISAELKIGMTDGLVRILVNGTVGYSITDINTIADVGVNHVEYGLDWGVANTTQYLYSASLVILAPVSEVVTVQGYIKNSGGSGLANVPIQFGYAGTPNGQYLAYDVTNSTGGYLLQVNEGTYSDVRGIVKDYGNSTDPGSITHFTNVVVSGDCTINFTLPSNTSTVPSDLAAKTFWACRSLTLFSWTFGDYNSASYSLALDDITANMTAVNAIEIRVYLWGNNTDVYATDAWQSTTNAITFNSMTANGINTAGTKGFDVFIGIVLRCPTNRFSPSNPSTFFANYEVAVKKYCTWLSGGSTGGISGTSVNAGVVKWIAATFEPQVNFFVPAYNASLQTLIFQARNSTGNTTLIGFHHQDMSDPAIPTWSGNWWHDADFVFGFGWQRMTYKLDPTYAEMMAGWTNPPDWAYSATSDPNWPATAAKYPNWQEYINAFTTAENSYLTHDIPALINTGCPTSDGSNIYPWNGGPNVYVADDEEQALYFRTLFNFFDANILGIDAERYGDLNSISTSFRQEFAQGFIEKGLEAHEAVVVAVTIISPTNTTYTTSTVSVQLSASGGTIDTILWNCTFTNGTVAYANTVYTVATSMTLGNGSYIFNARANNTLGEWDEATVTFTVEIAAGPNHYYFNFPFYDLDTNDVESHITWQLYNSTQLLTYTESQSTLLNGTYTLKTYYHVSLINQTDFDTATYGNSTINILLQLKAYAYGYLAFSNTVTSLVLNSQSMYNLTFTVSGSVPTTMTIDFPESPTYINKAGVNQTGWTYTNGYVVLTAPNLSTWQIIYSPSAPLLPAPSEITNFLAFLLAGDFFGFIIALYTQAFGSADIFFGVVIMLVMVPLYIRTKSLMFMSILWILLGSLFLIATPLLSGLAVLLLVLGVGSMLFELFMINRRG